MQHDPTDPPHSIARWTTRLLGPLAVFVWAVAIFWGNRQVERDTLEIAQEQNAATASGVPAAPASVAPGGLDNRTLGGQMRAFHHLPAEPGAKESPAGTKTQPAGQSDPRQTP
jgi:hypothetical protein